MEKTETLKKLESILEEVVAKECPEGVIDDTSSLVSSLREVFQKELKEVLDSLYYGEDLGDKEVRDFYKDVKEVIAEEYSVNSIAGNKNPLGNNGKKG